MSRFLSPFLARFPSGKSWLCLLAFAVGLVLLALFVFHPFEGLSVSAGDGLAYDFGEYFFLENFRLLPYPHLNLITDKLLYPFGVEFVAHGWCLEKHYFTLVMTLLFGKGSWLAWYCWASFALGGLGTWFLVRRSYGFWQACWAAALVTFFSFTALVKFPSHLNLAVVHWAAVNIVADVILMQRYFDGKISLRFLGLRALLLFLALGLDVGYVAGFALSSFTLTAFFIAGHLGIAVWKSKGARARALGDLLLPYVAAWKLEIRRSPAVLALLGLGCVTLALFYLPILFQVVGAFSRYTWDGGGWYWANPLRILIPWFPGFYPGSPFWGAIFRDTPEMMGNMSPGWTVTLPALVGMVAVMRGRRRALYPLCLLFLIFLLNHPMHLPLIKVFPWFAQMRVAGRVSLVFPAMAAILSLEGVAWWRRRWAEGRWRVALVLLGLVPLVEFGTQLWVRPHFEGMNPNIEGYFSKVSATPGHALLEWPFCIAGGNSVAIKELCPFFERNATLYGLSRLHGKSLTSLYLGRVADVQVAPFLEMGWQHLFAPAWEPGVEREKDGVWPRRLPRCFTEKEWAFFVEFFRRGDFAGVQIYPELLAPGCAEEFHRRLGNPLAQIVLPSTGPTEFIPKPMGLQGQVDLSALKQLRFIPEFPLGEFDLNVTNRVAGLELSGFSGSMEKSWTPRPFRRVTSEVSTMNLHFEKERAVRFQITLLSGVPHQKVEILWNERRLGTLDNLRLGAGFESPQLLAPPGDNRLALRFFVKPSLSDFMQNLLQTEGVSGLLQVKGWHGRWIQTTRKMFAVATHFELQVDEVDE